MGLASIRRGARLESLARGSDPDVRGNGRWQVSESVGCWGYADIDRIRILPRERKGRRVKATFAPRFDSCHIGAPLPCAALLPDLHFVKLISP